MLSQSNQSMLDNNPIPDIFSVQQNIRRSMPKDRIEIWMRSRLGKVYRDLILDWLVILVAFISVAAIQSWWSYIIAFFTIGSRQYALFILGHDAIHNSLHPIRVVNDRLAKWLIYGPMFMGLEDGRRNHLDHHRYLGTELDPDRYLHALSNKNSNARLLLFCLGLATFGKTVLKVTPFGKMLTQAKDRTIDKNSLLIGTPSQQTKTIKILSNYLRQRLSVLLMQPLLIGFFILLDLPWWSYLALWVAPIYFCVFLPDEIRALCDHAIPILPESNADSLRLITFQPNWFELAIFSPHNMNYHAEHHLFPTVPYYNLPQVHDFTRNRAEVTVRKSYIAFLIKLFSSLPLSPSIESVKEQEYQSGIVG